MVDAIKPRLGVPPVTRVQRIASLGQGLSKPPMRKPITDEADFGSGNGSGEPRYATYGPDGKLISRTYGRDDDHKRSR